MMLKTNAWLHNIARYFSNNDAALPTVSLNAQLRWKFRYWLPKLGWPGILAIGLLAICLPFYLSTIRPMQARLDEAQRSAASIRDQALNASAAVRGGGGTPSEQLAEFYKYFPSENNSPFWLEKLAAVAEKNGLSLNVGEYKVTRDSAGQLMRFRITLPLHGKYPQIRKFLASLTTEIPIIALENVQFERNVIIDSAVKAKVKLVLYLVQEP